MYRRKQAANNQVEGSSKGSEHKTEGKKISGGLGLFSSGSSLMGVSASEVPRQS
jgi:hypothetical protein